MTLRINELQKRILDRLIETTQPKLVNELAAELDADQSQVAATITVWAHQGWVASTEVKREQIEPSPEAADLLRVGFPERRILRFLNEAGGRLPLADVAQLTKEHGIPMNEIVKWGGVRGWLQKERSDIVLTEAGRSALHQPDHDELAMTYAVQREVFFVDQVQALGLDPERVRLLLKNRVAAAKLKDRIERWVTISPEGRATLQSAVVIKERNVLTSEDITSGGWRTIELRDYDVTLEAKTVYPAKMHPMRRILEEVRRTFLEMGFTEVVSPQAEVSFWNFDALFQPQDHPAREMQDTFYVARPNMARLPDPETVERVRRTHENGGDTGSTGWGYRWSPERARQVVMRTHTTATSIRALSKHPEPPLKVFSVGTVYRNETITYKHLPEFFQVDGIIVDENASLASLLGTLREFYRKMGFDKVKFKPGFFPYTEPSAEAYIYMESRKTWMEMGGSGIFRPEVTKPLGCRYPVIAWGLGLDRLAMRRFKFEDIRDLYWAQLDRIQEVPLCR